MFERYLVVLLMQVEFMSFTHSLSAQAKMKELDTFTSLM
jgi:hypothetical protein